MPHENDQPFVSDARLLRRFTREGAQAAFAEIVSRHYRLVYSVCLRDVHDATVAEDAAQAVFLLLARKAPALRGDGSLAGWLYRTARLVSKNALRREQRVRQKEQRAAQHMAQETQAAQNALWERIDPILHAALDALGRVEREAILLRFWDDLSLAETGAALGLSEDAARMRVTRALEKLKQFLVKEGVVLTASVLAGLLTEKSARAIATPSARLASPNAHQLAQGAIRTMIATKMSITTALVAASLGGIWGAQTVKSHPVALPSAVLRPATASAMDPQAQVVITQAASATAALHSLKADYTYTISVSGGQARPETVRSRGTLVLQRPNLARVENGNITVSDGSHRWFWAAAVNKYEETAVSQDGRDFDTNADVVPVVSFFFDPSLNGLHAYENKKDYDFRTSQPVSGPFPAKARFLGSENWRGLTCQVIEAVREVPYHNTLKVYLGPDHLVHRTVAERTIDFGTRKGQTETDELALTGLQTNAALPLSTFTFVPPPGSEPFPPKP